MTDRNRALRTLPTGYQFGDARPYGREEREFYARRARYAPPANAAAPRWRPLHLNAADRLNRAKGDEA